MATLQEDVLGSGSYGIVRRISSDNKLYAQKLIPIKNAGISAPIELDILSRLKHPHLLSMLSFKIVNYNNYNYYAIDMYLANKGDLFNYIKSNNKLLNSIDFGTKIQFMAELVDVVSFLHYNRILHLDIKPENILVYNNADNGNLFLQLADTGLSVFADRLSTSEITENSDFTIPEAPKLFKYSKSRRITKIYRPPENLMGSHNYTEKSDIWSLAITFIYILSSGKLPYNDQNSYFYDTLKDSFNDPDRHRQISLFLNYLTINDSRYNLTIDLLTQMLNPDPSFRINIEKVKKHQLFSDYTFKNGYISLPYIGLYSSVPVIISNLLIHYQTMYTLIDLSYSYNIKVESLFLALDLYYRTIELQSIPQDNYLDTLTTGLVCFWLALKLIETQKIYEAISISIMSNNKISVNQIITRESNILVGLQGMLYRYNLFSGSGTLNNLISNFEILTNLPKYISYDIKWTLLDNTNLYLTQLNCQDYLVKTKYWTTVPPNQGSEGGKLLMKIRSQ